MLTGGRHSAASAASWRAAFCRGATLVICATYTLAKLDPSRLDAVFNDAHIVAWHAGARAGCTAGMKEARSVIYDYIDSADMLARMCALEAYASLATGGRAHDAGYADIIYNQHTFQARVSRISGMQSQRRHVSLRNASPNPGWNPAADAVKRCCRVGLTRPPDVQGRGKRRRKALEALVCRVQR